MKVAAIGDNVVDIYLDQKRMYLGGNSLNFANFATEFVGVESMYIGNFGNDDLSDYVMEVLRDLTVDYHFSRVLQGDSGYSKLTLEKGERVFITSNRGGVLQSGINIDVQALREINQCSLVHFNINGKADNYLENMHGPKVIYDYSDFSSFDQIKKTINQVDIACFSVGNLEIKAVRSFLNKVLRLATNPSLVVLITMGSKGAIAYRNGKIYRQKALEVQSVVDTMGAGDAFITAFSINLLQEDSMVNALETAAKYSAKQIQRPGSFGYGTEAPDRFLKTIENGVNQ
ncbi:PfkB family carbohydrate kinase [uncultured Secundilactobacillus sp.]|uniref:PfkB family carbohydrate kinase n=1 Tax=uncultured Secundilactobacillus sp. TaxID=2813935 RepID=UPI002585BCB1|nr:PfkB family carbohydrate kinase [uncultured Secundilactobacillus sp.]